MVTHKHYFAITDNFLMTWLWWCIAFSIVSRGQWLLHDIWYQLLWNAVTVIYNTYVLYVLISVYIVCMDSCACVYYCEYIFIKMCACVCACAHVCLCVCVHAHIFYIYIYIYTFINFKKFNCLKTYLEMVLSTKRSYMSSSFSCLMHLN